MSLAKRQRFRGFADDVGMQGPLWRTSAEE